MEKEKLPINVTFEVVQHREPNDRWFTVTAVLSWPEAVPEPFYQRMDAAMVWQDELDEIKEAYLFLIGRTFDIQEVKSKPSRLEEDLGREEN